MSNDGFEQLSAVVGLSREKDGISLTRTLIDALGRLAPGIEAAVMEVYGRRTLDTSHEPVSLDGISIRRFDDTGQRLHRSGPSDDLMDVILRLQPRAVESPQGDVGRLTIPLSCDIGPLRLVILEHVPVDPYLRAKALQIVEIYGNLIRLMDSRERDALTGLLNRQTFATLFELASHRVQALPGHTLTLGVLDIDHFKRVNDTFGHLYGDEVLIHFARLMERSFRYTDDLFRFGGEEFVVLLTTERSESARAALDRFRRVVEEHAFPGVGQVTVSIGHVTCHPGILPTTLVDRADKALYHAKENGRNRVVDFGEVGEQTADASGDVDLF